jgi:hypothetical protein
VERYLFITFFFVSDFTQFHYMYCFWHFPRKFTKKTKVADNSKQIINVIIIINFFKKWRPSRCALALDSSEEQDFPESNFITAHHMEKAVFRGANWSSVFLELCWSSLISPPRKWLSALRRGAPPEF